MSARKGVLVLGVHLTARGIAFTLFESPLSPVDWGTKEVRGRRNNEHFLKMLIGMLDRLQPDVLVLENMTVSRDRKAGRLRRLNRLISNYAQGQAIELYRFSRKEVQACFAGSGAKTRYEIAHVIASHVHALGHRLPSVRQIYGREDERMGLFDAASFVLTYYSHIGGSPLAEDRPQGL